MKVRVTLYVGGTTFEEVVNVATFEDANKTALARNPTAKVVAMNPIPFYACTQSDKHLSDHLIPRWQSSYINPFL